jgi:phage terminase small subunit
MAGTGRKPYETTEVAQFGVETGRLQPPECLGNLQKQAFIDLVCGVPRSQFRRCDLPLLCRWAELTVMAEQAAFELQQGGMVVNTKEGSKVSPWFQIHRDATRELRSLSQRLQIGPRGRTPKAPKTKPGTVSYYERMALEGDYDDPN